MERIDAEKNPKKIVDIQTSRKTNTKKTKEALGVYIEVYVDDIKNGTGPSCTHFFSGIIMKLL